jgi:hypothetical protein
MPTTLVAFGNTFGIGEHKRDTYGERFIAVIKEYSPAKEELPFPEATVNTESASEQKEDNSQTSQQEEKKPKNQITIQGTKYDINLDIWKSIEWRKVLKDITERAYWNYQGPLEIQLGDYVAPSTEHRDRIIATLCHLFKDGYRMNVDEQAGTVTIAQKYDYDDEGKVVEFPSGSFYEILSRFRLFVIKNKRYPFMDGEHDEIALRKWFREVGHGLVAITDEQKLLFDNISVEFADMPKNRGQFEKMAEDVAVSQNDAVDEQEDDEIEEPEIDPELEKLLNTPIRHLFLSAKTSKFLIDLGYDIFEEIPQIESPEVLIKARKGGSEVANEVEQFLENYNLTFGMSYDEIVEQIELPDEDDINESSTSRKQKPLPKTIQTTLDLAKQGYTFEAIAWKRELSALTISKHLSILILRGLVEISDFVDRYEYNLISNVMKDMPKGASTKSVKSLCPQGIKRNTIRMVIADLKRKQKTKNKS